MLELGTKAQKHAFVRHTQVRQGLCNYERVDKVRHRVGIIGAGQICPYHASALRRISGVHLAGIYDLDPRRSELAAKALGTRAFQSVDEFKNEAIDVVHVLTPPETHAAVALEALRLGAHVLVEKPLATDVTDCERVAALASERGLRVCVDHSLLYDFQIMRAIETARSGAIGRVISVNIFRSAEYPVYEGGPLPPHYRSAGYPFRDLGVHQLYLLAAFLGPIEDVRAQWYSAGGFPNLIFDEWRADVQCRNGRGHFEISFSARPIQNTIVIQGTKGSLRVEQMSMYSMRRAVTPFPKAAERVINAYGESVQSIVQVSAGVAGFIRKTLRQYDGVQRLVGEFYHTLDKDLPVPVSVADAIPIVHWVENVARAADDDAAKRAAAAKPLSKTVPILVTGAAGGLGSAVVARLLREGRRLRVFVRPNSIQLPEGVEVASGDLADPVAVDKAVRGARIVIHAGAATKGDWPTQRASTVVGTQNIIDACLRNGVEQLVYISSLSVVQWAGARGEPISEASPLEPHPEARGAYTRAKLQAELLVRGAVERLSLRAVILRPGQIFGARHSLLNPAVARKVGRWRIVLGDGKQRLPLIYIDDVVDGICCAIEKGLVRGEIIHLVDSALPTQNEILERTLNGSARVVRIPSWAVFTGGFLTEIAFKAFRRYSPLSRYRLRSALAQRRFVSENAESILHWRPRTGVRRGIESTTPFVNG